MVFTVGEPIRLLEDDSTISLNENLARKVCAAHVWLDVCVDRSSIGVFLRKDSACHENHADYRC